MQKKARAILAQPNSNSKTLSLLNFLPRVFLVKIIITWWTCKFTFPIDNNVTHVFVETSQLSFSFTFTIATLLKHSDRYKSFVSKHAILQLPLLRLILKIILFQLFCCVEHKIYSNKREKNNDEGLLCIFTAPLKTIEWVWLTIHNIGPLCMYRGKRELTSIFLYSEQTFLNFNRGS